MQLRRKQDQDMLHFKHALSDRKRFTLSFQGTDRFFLMGFDYLSQTGLKYSSLVGFFVVVVNSLFCFVMFYMPKLLLLA